MIFVYNLNELTILKSNLIKLIFLFCLCILSSKLSAQIEQGTFNILPELSVLVNTKKNSDRITGTRLLLSPGIFVAKNFSINLDLGFSSFRNSSGVKFSDSTSASFGLRLVYMKPITEKFYIPILVGYHYSINAFNLGNGNFTLPNSSNIYFGAAVEYLPSDSMGLRFSLVNNFIKFENDDLRQYNLSALFGICLYLARKSK